MCPRNNIEISKVDGKNAWVVACSTHKSIFDKLGKDGLIDGEPKNDTAWTICRQWIKSGEIKAVVWRKYPSRSRIALGYAVAFTP
jgi:hypothetical protein